MRLQPTQEKLGSYQQYLQLPDGLQVVVSCKDMVNSLVFHKISSPQTCFQGVGGHCRGCFGSVVPLARQAMQSFTVISIVSVNTQPSHQAPVPLLHLHNAQVALLCHRQVTHSQGTEDNCVESLGHTDVVPAGQIIPDCQLLCNFQITIIMFNYLQAASNSSLTFYHAHFMADCKNCRA